MDVINSAPILRNKIISKTDTALFFKATITQFNFEIYQTTIFRRIRETNKPFESYRWVQATLIETSKEVLQKNVDPEFPLKPNGNVDWDTGWDSAT